MNGQVILDLLDKIKPYDDGADVPREYAESLLFALTGREEELQAVLGVGGEAVTLLAKNSGSGLKTVYKVAFSEFVKKSIRVVRQYSQNPNDFDVSDKNLLRERFLRGARLQEELACVPELKTLGVVPAVYEIVETPVLYVKMGYFPGWSVLDWIGAHSLSESLNLFMAVLDFFGQIHRFGIVHRDIKPQNLLVFGGKLCVLDWTMAKNITINDRLTVVGFGMGSPMYRSDVVAANAKRATALDDIFSLGVLLSAFVLRHEPAIAPNENLLEVKHRQRYFRRIYDSLPPDFQLLFKRATNDGEHRYQSCIAFRDDLREVMAKMAMVADGKIAQDSADVEFSDFDFSGVQYGDLLELLYNGVKAVAANLKGKSYG